MSRLSLAAGALLLLGGCTYGVPLSNPADARPDDDLIGIWHFPSIGDDSASADVRVLPLPRNQYLVTVAMDAWLGGGEQEQAPRDTTRCARALRGWALEAQYLGFVTEVDGARFLNLAEICGDPGYALARYWVRGDTVRFATVDNLEGSFAASAELAAAVRARLDDPRLYSDTAVGHRVARRGVSVTAAPGTPR